MKTYENYHTHRDGSNVYVPDTPMKFNDYLKRTDKLGHFSISSIEHGWVGNYFSDYLELEKHNKKRIKEGKKPLKWLYGGEFYRSSPLWEFIYHVTHNLTLNSVPEPCGNVHL